MKVKGQQGGETLTKLNPGVCMCFDQRMERLWSDLFISLMSDWRLCCQDDDIHIDSEQQIWSLLWVKELDRQGHLHSALINYDDLHDQSVNQYRNQDNNSQDDHFLHHMKSPQRETYTPQPLTVCVMYKLISDFMSAAMRAADTVQLWLCDQGAALTWSAGSHWIGPPGPEATRTSPAEPQTDPRASGWRYDEAHLRQVHRYEKWEFKLTSQTPKQTANYRAALSPLLLKYSLEYLPDRAKGRGMGPSSSMMWAMWSEQGEEKYTQWSTLQYSTARMQYSPAGLRYLRLWCSLRLSEVQTDNLLSPAQTPETQTSTNQYNNDWSWHDSRMWWMDRSMMVYTNRGWYQD